METHPSLRVACPYCDAQPGDACQTRKVRPSALKTPHKARRDRDRAGASLSVVASIKADVDTLEHGLESYLNRAADADDVAAMAVLVADLQDLRRRLSQVEAEVARRAGSIRHAAETNGEMPGGGVYTLRRGATRKAWDHDGWKTRVLNLVLDRHEVHRDDQVVNAETGAAVDVAAIVQEVEAAHGSTAPKVSILKGLGIDPDEFCESTPGPWTFQVTR